MKMKIRTLLITTAAVSLIAGTGFAFADDADDADQGPSDQTTRVQPNAPDQSMSDQGYSQHWFSSTGYGPNDDQADQTRALNREQLGADHVGTSHDRDDEDMQGPQDDAAPPDADDNDDDRGAPPPSDDR